MAFKVKMPKFGETMEEGTVSEWLVQEGEKVEKGDPFFTVETDKSVLEVEAEQAGVLKKILVEENEAAPIGAMIAILGEKDEDIDHLVSRDKDNDEKIEIEQRIKNEKEEKEIKKETEDMGITAGDGKVMATPSARRVAAENKIDLTFVEGNGEYGSIKKEDVLAFVDRENQYMTRSLTGIRKTTAVRMTESYQEIPHVTLHTRINMTEVMECYQDLKDNIKQLHERRLTVTDVIVKAVVTTLENHKSLNAHFVNNKIRIREEINIGLAVAIEKGLVVPVIKNAGTLSLSQIAEKREYLVEKARQGALSPDELHGATFTITNLGPYDIEYFTPIINKPEVAILGIGKINKEATVIADEIKICSMMGTSLSFDHRANDGAPAASFLQELKKILEGFYPIFI